MSTATSGELLRAGLACHFVACSSDAALAQLEATARRNSVGFWHASAAKPACAARAAMRRSPAGRGSERTGAYHGNTQSRVYHAPHCPNYRCGNCTESFSSAEAARAAGYRPAGDCLGRWTGNRQAEDTLYLRAAR